MSPPTTKSNSGLCDFCCGVSPYTVSSVRTTSTGHQLGYHHRTYEDLEISSRRCPLCKLMLDELIKSSHPIKLRKGKVHQVLLSSDKYHSGGHTRREVCGITVGVTNSNARAFLHAWADEPSDAALSGDVTGRTLHPAADSPGAFHQIQTWLNTCQRSHTECDSVPLADADTSSITRFPTRLLDVGTNHDKTPFIRLTDRQNAMGPYAALSYCWGPEATQLRTLKSNLAEHATGINICTMPATLRDAVTATRNLGLRYLWIDALCIIQDDTPDWLREAPQMGLIYQNAHLTIAATGSSSSTGGLFHPRDTTTNQPVVELSYQPPGGGGRKLRTFFVGPHPPSFDKVVTASVWNSRGWVIQERNLSRRIILFAAGQLFFECIRHSVGEDGLVLVAHQDKRLGSASLWLGSAWAWCSIAQNYTACNLTYGEDKLFAIEGMIANVKARDPTDSMSFCAGVAVGGPGTNILPVNLMWHADKNRPMEEVKLRDTTTWKQRAPSWSWASLEGPVAWEPFVLDGRVECHTEVLGGVPYGLTPDDQTVREARLLFRGLAAEVMRSPAEKLGDVGCDIHAYLLDFEEHAACYALLGGVGKEVLGWGVFDRGDKVAGPFMAVVVSRNVDEEDAQCQSLNVLLVKQSAAETGYVYVRVGMGELTNFANLEFKERELIIA